MSTKLSPKIILAWLFSLGIPALISLIPTSELYTPTMRIFLIISVMAILMIAFENVPQPAVTFLLPAAYIAFGVCAPDMAWTAWTRPVFWMVVGALLMVNVLQSSGILTRISFSILKVVGGSYTSILISIALIGTVLNVILFANGYVLLAALAFGLCDALQIEKGSKEGAAIFLTAAISGIVTGAFCYGSNLFMVQAYWDSVIHTNIGWAEFTFFMIPAIVYFILAVVLVIVLYRSKKDMNSKAYAAEQLRQLGKMSAKEIKATVWILIMFAYVMYCGFTGGDCTMAFVVIPGLMLLPGVGCGSGQDVKDLDFTFILFVASCMTIGFVAGSLGFGELISALSAPLVASTTPTMLTIILYWLNVILNFVLTPMAIMAGFTATFTQIAVDAGMNPMVIYAVEQLGLDQILFPYEYALYMLYFSFGFISMKEFVKYFGAKMLLGFLCLVIIMIPFWKIAGVFML